MHFISSDGQSFELVIIGYQFPGLESEPYDSNWLLIEGKANHPRGRWVFRDACLLTYEVERLAHWLSDIAISRENESECSFVEPLLEFRVERVNDTSYLRVYFEVEARPVWANADAVGIGDLWVGFPLTELDLTSAAAALRRQLVGYPQRTRR